jgi:hypothetical protein
MHHKKAGTSNPQSMGLVECREWATPIALNELRMEGSRMLTGKNRSQWSPK